MPLTRITTPKESLELLLFGRNITDLVPSLAAHSNKLDLFRDTYASVPTLEWQELEAELHNIETKLTHTILDQVRTTKLNTLTIKESSIYTLSDTAIEHIFNVIPPKNLLTRIPSSILQKLSARTQLALTRFTEPLTWHECYLETLTTLPNSAFTKNEIEVTNVPESFISILHIDNLFSRKPWGLTHSKEAGVVLVRDNCKNQAHNLLTLAVLLHYEAEIKACSAYVSNTSSEYAINLVRVLSAKSSGLNFLKDTNAHDETIYWDIALSELQKHVAIPDVVTGFIKCKIDDTTTPVNFIDMLWNHNLASNCRTWKYHAQQKYWLQALEALLPNSISIHSFVTDRLHQNNQQFLDDILHHA